MNLPNLWHRSLRLLFVNVEKVIQKALHIQNLSSQVFEYNILWHPARLNSNLFLVVKNLVGFQLTNQCSEGIFHRKSNFIHRSSSIKFVKKLVNIKCYNVSVYCSIEKEGMSSGFINIILKYC